MSAPERTAKSTVAIVVWDDTNNKFKVWDGVLSTGDLSIGAVELKDGTTDARAVVSSDGTDNALVVQANVLPLPTGAATETTLLGVKQAVESPLPAGDNNIGNVDVVSSALPDGAATEATLSAAEVTLDSIKDTAGIKKITDELPAGTQIIGEVGIDQTTPGTTNNVSVTTVKPDGTNTMPSGDATARPLYTRLTDGTNDVDVVTDEGKSSIRTVTGINDGFHVALNAENISATTGYILVDLSDSVNFPHTNTDHVLIHWIDISVNPTTTFTGDICIGYLSAIDGTDATLNVLKEFHLDKKGLQINHFTEYNSSHFSASASSGLLDFTLGVTQFNTGSTNARPGNGTATPADGDLVMLVTVGASTVDVGISLGYETAP